MAERLRLPLLSDLSQFLDRLLIRFGGVKALLEVAAYDRIKGNGLIGGRGDSRLIRPDLEKVATSS